MKRFWMVVCALLLILSLVSCGSEAAFDQGAKSAERDSYYAEDNWGAPEEASAASENSDSSSLTERKQIFHYDLSLKTSSFDDLCNRIRSETRALGGYVESMDQDQYGDYRTLTMVVRIPAEKAEGFVDGVAGSAEVSSRGQSSEDVTLEYVDVETRLKNLESERQALNAMMEKAESVEDLISIQSRLSDVQYEIESYTARRNKIDELVGLSTVSFTIREVDREGGSADPDQGIWGEIATGFLNNLYAVGGFFKALFVGLIAALPILLIPAIIILVIVLLIRRSVRKKKKARAAMMVQVPSQMQQGEVKPNPAQTPPEA